MSFSAIQKEAALAARIVTSWPDGFGDLLFGACGLTAPVPRLGPKLRVPATDIAWREFDLITEAFEDRVRCRLIVELKVAGIGYRSMAQVIFYKHVLAPRHITNLGAGRLKCGCSIARTRPRIQTRAPLQACVSGWSSTR